MRSDTHSRACSSRWGTIPFVAGRLGHGPSVTLRTYAKLVRTARNEQRKAALDAEYGQMLKALAE